LLYNAYNPDTLESIRLRDVSNLNLWWLKQVAS
jgi:hypothetical protein